MRKQRRTTEELTRFDREDARQEGLRQCGNTLTVGHFYELIRESSEYVVLHDGTQLNVLNTDKMEAALLDYYDEASDEDEEV